MFQEMMPVLGSGGDSGVVGDKTPAMSSGGTCEIDTGLTEVHHFVWFATNTANNMQNVLTYDSSMGNYFTGSCPANFGGVFKRAINSSAATQSAPGITSISGGKVSIQTSTSYGNVQQGYWYAD